MDIYDPKTIEPRWRQFWLDKKVYQPDLAVAKKPYYNLMMFPYPSAEGLHVGNMYAFTGADVHGRFKRMQGFDVFQPIGLDGFGIHSENYAIKVGRHPKEHAKISEKHFYEQLHMIGDGFAWDQKLETYDPEYYRWTQWLFVQMYKHNLAYRKKAMVNWCPSCKTVLSDEQVEGGVCERCKTATTRKETEQWFFKITAYADQLLNNIPKLNWPKKITIAQQNWIGKKEGVIIHHKVNGLKVTLDAFSAYPAWLFADTFLVIAPDHPIIEDLQLEDKYYKDYKGFLNETKKITVEARQADKFEKKGVFTGRYVRDPFTGGDMPIWLANFALLDVGTGIIRCSSHDPRDYEFAKKYDISLREIVERNKEEPDKPIHAHINKGTLKNSGEFTGRNVEDILEEIVEWIVEKKIGKRVTTYHLRDWLISRQRYWGPPIPMVNCPKCGWNPMPEDQLPVLLPDIKDFKPTGDGLSPLQKAPKSWLETVCPKCGGVAKRETDVSDTFLDSSWYFLAYPNLKTKEFRHSSLRGAQRRGNLAEGNIDIAKARSLDFARDDSKSPFNLELTKKWLPVNAYIGGAEHAVLHLLYARFVWMCFKDWGYLSGIDSPEPFPSLFSHGLIIKDGAKMSKSRGNVVNPDEYINRYGADALRMYLMFLGSYDQGGDFRDTGMVGMYRFLERIWRAFQKQIKTSGKAGSRSAGQNSDKEIERILNKTIKKVTEDIAKFKYNTAIASLMEFMNAYEERVSDGKENILSTDDAGKLIKLFAPFAPYITEEIWHYLYPDSSGSIHSSSWPEYNSKILEGEMVEIPVQINGKTRAIISADQSTAKSQSGIEKMAMEDLSVMRYIEGKKINKIIFVSGKIINLIVN